MPGYYVRCPHCGNESEGDYVRRCNECGQIYCDRCGGAECPSCGASYNTCDPSRNDSSQRLMKSE